MEKVINLKISNAARKRITEFLEASDIESPTPGLLFGKKNNEQSEEWTVGVYTQQQIDNLKEMYSSENIPILYEADNITLCIPQPNLISKLENKTLDITKYGYIVI